MQRILTLDAPGVLWLNVNQIVISTILDDTGNPTFMANLLKMMDFFFLIIFTAELAVNMFSHWFWKFWTDGTIYTYTHSLSIPPWLKINLSSRTVVFLVLRLSETCDVVRITTGGRWAGWQAGDCRGRAIGSDDCRGGAIDSAGHCRGGAIDLARSI